MMCFHESGGNIYQFQAEPLPKLRYTGQQKENFFDFTPIFWSDPAYN